MDVETIKPFVERLVALNELENPREKILEDARKAGVDPVALNDVVNVLGITHPDECAEEVLDWEKRKEERKEASRKETRNLKWVGLGLAAIVVSGMVAVMAEIIINEKINRASAAFAQGDMVTLSAFGTSGMVIKTYCPQDMPSCQYVLRFGTATSDWIDERELEIGHDRLETD